jgi:hypothetical protein
MLQEESLNMSKNILFALLRLQAREERSRKGRTTGFYSWVRPDGLMQVVQYRASKGTGYQADVDTEEQDLFSSSQEHVRPFWAKQSFGKSNKAYRATDSGEEQQEDKNVDEENSAGRDDEFGEKAAQMEAIEGPSAFEPQRVIHLDKDVEKEDLLMVDGDKHLQDDMAEDEVQIRTIGLITYPEWTTGFSGFNADCTTIHHHILFYFSSLDAFLIIIFF